MTQLPADAPLRIVRWCWPDRVWVRDPGGIAPDSIAYSDGPPFAIYRDFTERDDVADAERVVIERGLAEDYGCALFDELDLGPRGPFHTDLYEVWGKIATAPIEARVRALLAVIEGQEKKNQ